MFKGLFDLWKKKEERTLKLQGTTCFLQTFLEQDAKELSSLLARNKYFWSTYEPIHREEFYTEEAQYKKIIEGLQLMSLKREFSFGIYDQQTKKLIGHISLYAVKKLPYSSAFVGYSMDEAYTGRGIATEAVTLVVQFAFRQLDLHRVEAYVAPSNLPSRRVIEKSGFVQEGLLRELLFINGKWIDHYMYAILKDDFVKIEELSRK